MNDPKEQTGQDNGFKRAVILQQTIQDNSPKDKFFQYRSCYYDGDKGKYSMLASQILKNLYPSSGIGIKLITGTTIPVCSAITARDTNRIMLRSGIFKL